MNSFGTVIGLDEDSSNGVRFNCARIRLKVKLSFILQQKLSVIIDGNNFSLFQYEERKH